MAMVVDRIYEGFKGEMKDDVGLFVYFFSAQSGKDGDSMAAAERVCCFFIPDVGRQKHV